MLTSGVLREQEQSDDGEGDKASVRATSVD